MDVIGFSFKRKGKLNKAEILRLRVMAFKGIGGAGIAACVGIERKADGIKDGGFTGTGWSGNQENSAFKLGEINFHRVRIGTKRMKF